MATYTARASKRRALVKQDVHTLTYECWQGEESLQITIKRKEMFPKGTQHLAHLNNIHFNNTGREGQTNTGSILNEKRGWGES